MGKKRVLLGATHSVIEPLGLLHLGGLARDMGWDRQFSLVKEHNFDEFFSQVRDFKPDVVGFNVYTGNHRQTHEAFRKLKKDYPNVQTIIGGPHVTYFPSESLEVADFVVMSEGFGAFERILRGEAKPGILPMSGTRVFPHPDRETLYAYSPEHMRSTIKSIIGETGCPFKCTYCYNSSGVAEIAKNAPPEVIAKLVENLGPRARLFPNNIRSVDDIIKEGREVAERWPTNVFYFQDDVFGIKAKEGGTLEVLSKRWKNEVGIPFHAQMRWEMTNGDEGNRRLDLVRDAGGFGLTLAIEAADPRIRAEVLDRLMPQRMMFEGMKRVTERGMKVRTEQITGLPYGATSEPSPVNLEADLQLIQLNASLRRESGGPNMAWGSTFAPYMGTKLYEYCKKFGHYVADNSDVPDTFFKGSVLRFPKEWIGLKLEQFKDDPNVWLNPDELDKYRKQNAELRGYFNFFAAVPQGEKLARNYLTSSQPFGYERLGRETEEHLTRLSANDNEAREMLTRVHEIRARIPAGNGDAGLMNDVRYLAPMFACLPKGELALQRTLAYAKKGGEESSLRFPTVSTAVRHSFYEDVLYFTDDSPIASGMNRRQIKYDSGRDASHQERYPAKV